MASEEPEDYSKLSLEDKLSHKVRVLVLWCVKELKVVLLASYN